MKVKIGNVFDLQMGKTPARKEPSLWNGNNKWISISDMGKGKYISETKECISDEGVKKSGIKPVPKNTVIMSFKLSIGKTAITAEEMYTNEAIMAFIDKKEQPIDINYIYHLFNNFDWARNTNKAVMGLVLNKAKLLQIEIPIPSIDRQNYIAKILDKIDSLINLRKIELNKLDELIKSRFIEIFGDPLNNSRNWPTVTLKSICSKIGSGATPKGGQASYIEHGISLIRSMNVHNGYFKYDDLAHINDEQAKQLNIVIVMENDILFNITGASVTRSCIVPNDLLPARVNQHVAIIRPNLEKVTSIFLNRVFLNDTYQHSLLNMAESNGATRQAITKQQLEMLIIPLPPIELQNQFTNFVNQINKSKSKIQNSLAELETLKKSLMQEYFA